MPTRDVCLKEEIIDWHVCLKEKKLATAGPYVCLSEKITDLHVCLTILNADTRRLYERGNYRLARMSEREKIAAAGWYVCMCRKIASCHVCLKEKRCHCRPLRMSVRINYRLARVSDNFKYRHETYV